jgi:hypothetical protein
MPVADSNGEVTIMVPIPAGLPVGPRTIHLTGDQGTVAQGTYIGTHNPSDPSIRWPSQRIVGQFYEPVAQTFTLDESRIIGAIEVEICAVGGDSPMWIQVRETTAGVPNRVCLGEALVNRSDFVTDGGFTQFRFDPPIPLNAGAEYAFVVITRDKQHKIAYAKIGETTLGSVPPEKVTQQPYQVGVLLLSSNASTWTPIQDADLRFRILACRFTQTEKVVSLGVVNTPATTDLRTKSLVWRPFGVADVLFDLSPTSTGGGNNLNPEDTPVQLSERLTGNIAVAAHLYGDEKSSPILAPNTQLVTANQDDTAEYASREIAAAILFDATICFDSIRKTGASIRAFMAVQKVTGGVDVYATNGQPVYEWVEFTNQDNVLPLNGGWTEEIWKLSNLRGVGLDRVTRVRLLLSGTPAARPLVRNLRVILV